MTYFCVIIGGGASGLAAAVSLSGRGKRVLILEKQERVGRKLLSTGNGRCNLLNLGASAADYNTPLAAAALAKYPPRKIAGFFEELGVPCRADEMGRAYPMSNQAASVLDALRLMAAERGAETLAGFDAVSIRREGNIFCVTGRDGRKALGKNVLVAAGGLAAPQLGGCGDGCQLLASMGVKIAPRFPALSPLKTSPEAVKGLKGQRLTGEIALAVRGEIVRREAGEILFGDASVSGIAAMGLARDAAQALAGGAPCEMRLRVLPEGEDGEAFLDARLRRLPDRALEDFLNGLVSKRIGQALMRGSGAQNQAAPARTLSLAERAKLAALLEMWPMPVTGVGGYDQAQVTAGGAAMADFFPETLECRSCPGLYAAGEVLDVDGGCGGYNLTWAWASALTAAEAMT